MLSLTKGTGQIWRSTRRVKKKHDDLRRYQLVDFSIKFHLMSVNIHDDVVDRFMSWE